MILIIFAVSGAAEAAESRKKHVVKCESSRDVCAKEKEGSFLMMRAFMTATDGKFDMNSRRLMIEMNLITSLLSVYCFFLHPNVLSFILPSMHDDELNDAICLLEFVMS